VANAWFVIKAFFLTLLLLIYVWFCLSVFTLGVVPYKVYYWLTGDEGLARDLAILTFMVSVPGFYILTMFFKELYEKTRGARLEKCTVRCSVRAS